MVKSFGVLFILFMLVAMFTPQEVIAQNGPGAKKIWNRDGGCSNYPRDCTIGDPIDPVE